MRLKKDLGQHLLLSRGVLEKIADFLEVSEKDTLVEIGGGTGNLTRVLLGRNPKKIYVLEIDPAMVKKLKEIDDPKLEVLREDATTFDLCSFGCEVKVTGNLPYNIASLVIERVVLFRSCVPLAVFTVQKEVGLKLAGKSEMGWLTVFLNTFYETEYLMSIPPRFFFPRPKVVSGVVRLRRRGKLPEIDTLRFKGFLTRLFSSKKRKLKNIFPEESLKSAGIEPSTRPHKLTQEEILRLYNVLER